MTLRTFGVPVAMVLGGVVLILAALQLMTTDLMMVPAVGLVGIGGLLATYGVVWLAELIGGYVRGDRRPPARRR